MPNRLDPTVGAYSALPNPLLDFRGGFMARGGKQEELPPVNEGG